MSEQHNDRGPGVIGLMAWVFLLVSQCEHRQDHQRLERDVRVLHESVHQFCGALAGGDGDGEG